MTEELKTRSAKIRLTPTHDDALKRLARRRGCDVSDLWREAVIEYFRLPVAVSQNNETLVSSDNANG